MVLYKKILIGVGAFILAGIGFIAIIFLFASILTSGLKDPIEKQLAAIRAEDYATAYSYTTYHFQEVVTLDAFRKYVNQYSGLRNNERIYFNEREINDNIGNVKATLKSRSGALTPIRYQLLKQNDQWRIQNMVISSDEAKVGKNTESNISQVQVDKKTEPTNVVNENTTVAAPAILDRTYEDPRYHFTIQYPSDWSITQPSDGTVVFTKHNEGLEDTIVQMRSKSSVRQTVNQAFSVVNQYLLSLNAPIQVIEEGQIPVDKNTFQGKYRVFTYTLNGSKMAVLEVVLYRKLSRALYQFSYASPVSKFEDNLATAKAMLQTFLGR